MPALAHKQSQSNVSKNIIARFSFNTDDNIIYSDNQNYKLTTYKL